MEPAAHNAPPPRTPLWLEAAGWIGTVAILAAYALNTFGWIPARHLGYQAMNLLGAAGIGANAWSKRAYPAFAVEAAWCVLTLAAVARYGFFAH